MNCCVLEEGPIINCHFVSTWMFVAQIKWIFCFRRVSTIIFHFEWVPYYLEPPLHIANRHPEQLLMCYHAAECHCDLGLWLHLWLSPVINYRSDVIWSQPYLRRLFTNPIYFISSHFMKINICYYGFFQTPCQCHSLMWSLWEFQSWFHQEF